MYLGTKHSSFHVDVHGTRGYLCRSAAGFDWFRAGSRARRTERGGVGDTRYMCVSYHVDLGVGRLPFSRLRKMLLPLPFLGHEGNLAFVLWVKTTCLSIRGRVGGLDRDDILH